MECWASKCSASECGKQVNLFNSTVRCGPFLRMPLDWGSIWRPKRVVSRFTKKWAKRRKVYSRGKKFPCIPGLILIRSKQYEDCFLFFVLGTLPWFQVFGISSTFHTMSCYPLTVSIPNLVNKGRALLLESILPWQRWKWSLGGTGGGDTFRRPPWPLIYPRFWNFTAH